MRNGPGFGSSLGTRLGQAQAVSICELSFVFLVFLCSPSKSPSSSESWVPAPRRPAPAEARYMSGDDSASTDELCLAKAGLYREAWLGPLVQRRRQELEKLTGLIGQIARQETVQPKVHKHDALTPWSSSPLKETQADLGVLAVVVCVCQPTTASAVSSMFFCHPDQRRRLM